MDEVSVFSDDPLQTSRIWFSQGAELLHIVDLDGAVAGRPINDKSILSIAKEFPDKRIQVGGGIRDFSSGAYYIENGISRVIIGTAAVKDPEMLKEFCNEYPLGVDSLNGYVKTDGWIQSSKLKPEELRTLLQTSRVPKRQENMLMGIFDMEFLSVNDVMVPKNEIIGIDLNDDIETILKELQNIDYTYIPCFEDSIDNILGFLTINKKADFLARKDLTAKALKSELQEPLFVPENTSLSKQLANFQSANKRVGLIVDEYGDIEGIITLRAILEVIVGEITSDSIDRMDIMPQADGSFMIEGNAMIREINQRLNWELPTEGPKTLSGLILENVQTIPETNVGVVVGDYRIETILIKDNVIKIAKIEKIDTLEEEEEEEKE